MNYGLGTSLNGNLVTKLFAGAVYDSYQMKIYAQIYDNDTSFTVYEIPQKVTVLPEFSLLEEIMNKLILKDLTFWTNIILNEGSNMPSLEEIQTISSLLNEQSLKDKQTIMLNGSIFPQIFGPFTNFAGVSPVFSVILKCLSFNSTYSNLNLEWIYGFKVILRIKSQSTIEG